MKFKDPFITGERFQIIADISILNLMIQRQHPTLTKLPTKFCLLDGEVKNFQLTNKQQFETLKQAKRIFVYTYQLPEFFRKIAPLLHQPYVLISHNSDDPADKRFLPALEQSNLTHWFAQNAAFKHEKLTALPIGLANAQWAHGHLKLFRYIRKRNIKKTRLLYMNFKTDTNPDKRNAIFNFFKNNPLVTVSQGLAYKDYLEELASHFFCISPPGNGFDCHRIWECLYLGVIPIVERNPTMLHFRDLPILIIDDWRQITKDFLQTAYFKLNHSFENLEKADIRFWEEKIRGAAID
jgi:hypothetical protein